MLSVFFLTTTSWFDLFSNAGPLSLQYILVFVTASIFPVCILMIIFYNSCYYIRDRDNKRQRGTKKKKMSQLSASIIELKCFHFFFFLRLFLRSIQTLWLNCNHFSTHPYFSTICLECKIYSSFNNKWGWILNICNNIRKVAFVLNCPLSFVMCIFKIWFRSSFQTA